MHRSGLVWERWIEGGYYDVHEINFKLPLCRSLLALPRGRKGALCHPPAARNFFYYSMFQGNNGLDRGRNGEWYAFRVRHLRCKRTVKGHGTCSIPPTASEFVNPTTKYIMCTRTARRVFLITRFCFLFATLSLCARCHVTLELADLSHRKIPSLVMKA